MIDILIPVLGRPANAQPLVDNIHAATDISHTCLFICTRGDDDQIEACRTTGAVVLLTDDGDCQYARKINAGVAFELRRRPHPFVFLGADDLRFHPNWDHEAIAAYERSGKPVIGTNDLGNVTVMKGLHATHSLVRREYADLGTIDGQPGLLHEGYSHNFCDTEFIATAKHRDAFVFAGDSHVEHLHPFWKKGTDDVIYIKGRRQYDRDSKLFRRRSRLWNGRGRA